MDGASEIMTLPLGVRALSLERIRRMDFSWMQDAMPARWARARRFLREEDRLLCLGAGFLLRELLGIESEKEISFNEYGKPFAPGRKKFSLSHGGGLCAIAVSEREVGLDIEKIVQPFPAEAGAVFTEDEKRWAFESGANCGASADSRAYRLWTMKESAMKAVGLGFFLDPKSFSLVPALSGEAVMVGGKSWRVQSAEAQGYSVSVCAEARPQGGRPLEGA